ncbi:hypothetical protein ACWFR5_14420 [Streptomyces sp. NPDC055092]
MRIVEHDVPDGPDKILHVRSVGCDVNIIVGTHDPSGAPFTTIEIMPHQPDGDGVKWLHFGTSNVVVMPVSHAAPSHHLTPHEEVRP